LVYFPKLRISEIEDKKTANNEGQQHTLFVDKSLWSLSNMGSISSTFYEELVRVQITKAQKRQSSCQSLLCIWDLFVQKLLAECWWNWPLTSKGNTIAKGDPQLLMTKKDKKEQDKLTIGNQIHGLIRTNPLMTDI